MGHVKESAKLSAVPGIEQLGGRFTNVGVGTPVGVGLINSGFWGTTVGLPISRSLAKKPMWVQGEEILSIFKRPTRSRRPISSSTQLTFSDR
jgi:hypothetical protein